jgi:DDE family transposase
LAVGQPEVREQQLAEAHQGLKKLPKAGRRQMSRTDPDRGFLRTREGWGLGYTADIAVSDDRFIVAARVTQQATDNASLLPMVEEVERHCGQRPQKVTADAGFFSGAGVRECSRRGMDLYVPDNNLRPEMRSGKVAGGMGRRAIRDPEPLRMREKLRSPAGRKLYQRRQAVVEPVIGILKVQRRMRRFRRRGLQAVNTECLLVAIAYNIARLRHG